MGRVVSLTTLALIRRRFARQRKTVVFTNGTFDILHRGHVEYLAAARRMGDVLFVGLNSDASIRRIKGKGRPVNPADDRAAVLAGLASVDYVCVFGGNTPLAMIKRLVPDVLVKGGDWTRETIVGRMIVEAGGGKVRTIRLTPGRSTTGMIRRILRNHGGRGAARKNPARRKRGK